MAEKTRPSPRISSLSWGEVRVEGYSDPFRDVKLYPGGAREWDWTETGTHHNPGIQPADVRELLEHGAALIVLSSGFQERLGVSRDTLLMLEKAEITTVILPTEEAVEYYNALRESEAVGALIHTTC
jgi:hypothetical protein